MMPGRLERWIYIQHAVLILLVVWLYATSPWVHLYNRIPPSPTFWVWNHFILGVVTAIVSLTFCVSCLVQGRMRQYFPWAFGRFQPMLSDMGGLVRLKMPTNEGSGLFSVIKGLLLLSLLAVAATGLEWLWMVGSREAVAWRGWHIESARLLVIFLGLHVAATIVHLVKFLRQ